MRDTSRHGWQAWRVKRADSTATISSMDRFTAARFTAIVEKPAIEPLSASDPAEQPGPDGIRHGLVARVRAAIEAGAYDSEERWAEAEERLLARIEAMR